MSKKAVVMRGDGVGPQLADCMVRVLKGCNLQAEIITSETGLRAVGQERSAG